MKGSETLQSVSLLCPKQLKIFSINFTNPVSDQLPQMLALNCTFNMTVVLCAGMELQEPKVKELRVLFPSQVSWTKSLPSSGQWLPTLVGL